MDCVPVRMVNWVNTGPVEDLGGLCTSENGKLGKTGPVEDLGGLRTSENGNWVNTGPVTFRSAKLEIPQE